LLDIYCQKLRPSPTIPHSNTAGSKIETPANQDHLSDSLPSGPLGLGPNPSKLSATAPHDDDLDPNSLPKPYKAESLPLVDRLAARDRASTLLSGLTRLGTGWNYSEAWFTLARAHEESGQPEKAKEVLWWCVELEEAKAVRDWQSSGTNGYIL
jgi:cargo-transport protein YPP1